MLSLTPAVLAAGSASLSGPSVVRAGDTITLSFSAGGGIYGGSGSISYDSSQLTLKSYSQSVGGSWAVEFNGNNFVFYDNSMSSPLKSSTVIFKATFVVKSSLTPGTKVSVIAKGVTLSDGSKDMSAGSPTYSVTIAEPLSKNCNLASLTVSNAKISPSFSPDVTTYTASVPYSTSSLSVSAKAEHPNAKVSVGSTSLAVASTTSVKITVTAESGATKTYTIKVYRAQDPNYVPSSNANLSSLTAEGYQLSPAFATDVTHYYVWLPYEADTIALSAAAEDGKASVKVGEYEELIPGKGTDVPVTVKAEDGTELVYTVTVVRAPAHEDVERYLSCDHEMEPVTEPVTEPETQPPTVPETAPETQPSTEPAPQEEPAATDMTTLVITAILSAAAGAGIALLMVLLLNKKKAQPQQPEVPDGEEAPAQEEASEENTENQPE